MVKYIRTGTGEYRQLSFFSRLLYTWDHQRIDCYIGIARIAALIALPVLYIKFI